MMERDINYPAIARYCDQRGLYLCEDGNRNEFARMAGAMWRDGASYSDFVTIAMQYPGETEKNCSATWRSVSRGGGSAGPGSIVYLCRRAGIPDNVIFSADDVTTITSTPKPKKREPKPKESKPFSIPRDRLFRWMRNQQKSELYRHMACATFGNEMFWRIGQVWTDYLVGFTDYRQTAFVAHDIDHVPRWAQYIHYKLDGHRDKDAEKSIFTAGSIDCFFGEHLVMQGDALPLAIVEAPKTAIWGALARPGFKWLATAGGGNLQKLAPRLVGYPGDVLVIPDADKQEAWRTIADGFGWGCAETNNILGGKNDFADAVEDELKEWREFNREAINLLLDICKKNQDFYNFKLSI